MAAWAVFFHLSGYGGEYTVAGGIMPAAICFLCGALGMILGSLASSPPSAETIEKFFPKALDPELG